MSAPPGPPNLEINSLGSFRIEQGSIVHGTNVAITYFDTTLSADRVDGDAKKELIFSGHAMIEREGITAQADAIHLFPADGSYRLDNPRGVLAPSLFQGNVFEPVYVSGGVLTGSRTGYNFAERIIATTCREHFHHYELRIANAELIPHKRLVLRRVGVYFFGVKLITIPEIVVPLDQRPEARRPRTDYLPEFGENSIWGYYALFPYTFSEGQAAGTFIRADVTQNKGLGFDLQQEYLAGKQTSPYSASSAGYGGGVGINQGANGQFVSAFGYGRVGAGLPTLGTGIGPQNGGLLTLQVFPSEGFNKDFNASFQHQQSIGGSNRFLFSTQLQNNSSYITSLNTSTSSAQTTRFELAHNDATHGVDDDLSLNLTTNNSTGYSNSQITGSLRQAYQFASSGSTRNSISLDLNLSHLLQTYTSAGSSTPSQNVTRSERLDSQFQLQHVARDYSYTLDANDSTPIGFQSGNSNFGTLEKLPELMVSTDTFNYRGGWLRYLPTTLQFGIGEYSEPTSKITTDRVQLGFNMQPVSILRGRTEITTAAGFDQRFYGDGAALYELHDTANLRQHLGGRSGFDIQYLYDQPEGGTPFLFDQPRQSHSLQAEAGYLDDKNFQLTANVGYNLLGSAHTAPWQYLSTRMMWRPIPSVRFDATQTYDPNSGKFFSFTNMLRVRGPNDSAFDLVWQIDPNQPGIRRKFTQINPQFDVPLGRSWRVTGLLRFNGLIGKFESRNLQIVHDWDCMEASLTYTEDTTGFRPDRQIYLAIHIKAFPFYRAFNRGPAGEAIGTGLGNIY